MTLQYASDLHLEFPENRKFLSNNPLLPVGNVLLLAGDIVPFALLDKHNDFFNYLSDNFEHTYWLPGNHEYYHSDIGLRNGSFKEQIRSNVTLLNNASIELGDTRLVFSTLWSHISPTDAWSISQGLADYAVIKQNDHRLNPDYTTMLHCDSINFIKKECAVKSGRNIIITHHVPTFMHYPEQYRGSILNSAFATELYNLICEIDCDYWIYGHHHYNTEAFNINNTVLITNQLGYVHHNEHHQFKNNKIINNYN